MGTTITIITIFIFLLPVSPVFLMFSSLWKVTYLSLPFTIYLVHKCVILFSPWVTSRKPALVCPRYGSQGSAPSSVLS